LKKKVKKKQSHEKVNHYYQNEKRHDESRTENHLHSRRRKCPLDYDDSAPTVTNSAFYLKCITAGGPIATSLSMLGWIDFDL